MTESGGKSAFRMAHTMIRVKDLDRSLAFYKDILGMSVLRKKDYPSGEFTNCFVGYGPEESNTVIELTHNWGQEEEYDKGNGWGHLALEVPDVYATCDKLAAAGAKIELLEPLA